MESLVSYCIVVFFFTSSLPVFAADKTTRNFTTTQYPDKKDDCYISKADLSANQIDVYCGIWGYDCTVVDGSIKINNGQLFYYDCVDGYSDIITAGYGDAMTCKDGDSGSLPRCFRICEDFEYVPYQNTLPAIGLSSALGGVVLIWIVTLGVCWRKMKSHRRECHNCKHSEKELSPLPYSLQSTAPQVPERHFGPLPSPSPAVRTVSASLTNTDHSTAVSPPVYQEPNGKPVDNTLYDYVEPRLNDYYLEITS